MLTETHPSWSPDRELIAMVNLEPDKDPRPFISLGPQEYLITMKPDGTDKKALVYRHINAETYEHTFTAAEPPN